MTLADTASFVGIVFRVALGNGYLATALLAAALVVSLVALLFWRRESFLGILCFIMASNPLLSQGPAAPRPDAIATYLVSTLGMPITHWTCNPVTGLKVGGSPCYDDSAYLSAATSNGVFTLGTVSNPIEVKFDVSIGVASHLLTPQAPNISLVGLSTSTSGVASTGVFVLAGANSTLLCNGFNCEGLAPPGTPPAQSGSIYMANLYLNGNRGTYPNGNANSGGSAVCSPNVCVNVNFANLQSFVVWNVWSQDSPYFNIFTTNIGSQAYYHADCYSPSLGGNTDCLHMAGPTTGPCLVMGHYSHVGDDDMTQNAIEGYGGNMTGCTFSGIIEDGSLSAFRTYGHNSSHDYTVGPLFFNGVTGTTLEGTFQIGGFSGTSTFVDQIQGIYATNIKVLNKSQSSGGSAAGMFVIGEPVGDIKMSNSSWTPQFPGSGCFFNFSAPVPVSDFELSGTSIYQTAAGPYASCVGIIPTGASIKRFKPGISVINQQGQTWGALSYAIDLQSGGTIGTLLDGELDLSLISNVFNGNQWSRVTTVVGSPTGPPCASAASPAACGGASTGFVNIAAAASTVVVDSTSVTATSQVHVNFDASLGAALGVTCNTTIPVIYGISARTAGVSFTVSSSAPVTNPACFSYRIVN